MAEQAAKQWERGVRDGWYWPHDLFDQEPFVLRRSMTTMFDLPLADARSLVAPSLSPWTRRFSRVGQLEVGIIQYMTPPGVAAPAWALALGVRVSQGGPMAFQSLRIWTNWDTLADRLRALRLPAEHRPTLEVADLKLPDIGTFVVRESGRPLVELRGRRSPLQVPVFLPTTVYAADSAELTVRTFSACGVLSLSTHPVRRCRLHAHPFFDDLPVQPGASAGLDVSRVPAMPRRVIRSVLPRALELYSHPEVS